MREERCYFGTEQEMLDEIERLKDDPTVKNIEKYYVLRVDRGELK